MNGTGCFIAFLHLWNTCDFVKDDSRREYDHRICAGVTKNFLLKTDDGDWKEDKHFNLNPSAAYNLPANAQRHTRPAPA